MNTKITLPDLVSLLAARSGASRAVCERFIKNLFALVTESIEQGENVKIKDLGTFKVSNVDERKSVNVNTGAEMLIPGHRKVTFTPDKDMAALINAPFALFEPVELADNVTEETLSEADEPAPAAAPQPVAESPMPDSEPESAPATEPVVEALEDEELQHMPEDYETIAGEQLAETEKFTEEPKAEPEEPKEEAEEPKAEPEKVADSNSETVANVGNETTRQPESGSEQVDEELEPDPFEEAVEEQFSQPVVAAETPEEKEYSREDATVVSYPQSRFRKGVFVGAVAAILLLAGIICIWRWLAPASFCTVTCTSLAENRQAVIEKAEVAKPVSAAPAVIDTLPSSERIQPVENASNDREAAPTQPSDNDKNAKAEPEKKQKKVYDTITTKRFLTTMAKEHYGDYNLWPYIYDENAAILGHPDRIKPGTKVVIPPASKYGIDASNPACVAKAKKRGVEIYSRYR